MALRNDALVMTSLGRRPAATSSTISRPVSWACSARRLSGAGVPAMPGSVMPSASAMQAIVEAVPMVLQWPLLRIIADSDVRNASWDRVPARTSSLSRQTPVPQPNSWPRKVPLSIGPPGTTTAGRSTDAAAISRAGIVLSQPPSSTTPSIGLARIISSIDIAARLRHNIAVGSDLGLAQRHHRQVERNTARLPDALLDRGRHVVEVHVAGAEVRGGVGDRDVRPAVERVRRQPAPHPCAMDVGVAIGSPVPLLATLAHRGRTFHLSDWWSSIWNMPQPSRSTGATEPPPGDLRLVGSDRVLAVLAELARHPDGIGLDDMSRAVDSPKPTVHRALASLRRAGFARQDGHGRYLLGDELLRLAFAHHEARPEHLRVRGALTALAAEFGETAHYAVLDGHHVVYRAKVDPAVGAMKLTSTVGGRNTAHSTAVGKLLLSYRLTDQAAVRAWVAEAAPPRRTKNTLVTASSPRRRPRPGEDRRLRHRRPGERGSRQLPGRAGLADPRSPADRRDQRQRAGPSHTPVRARRASRPDQIHRRR